MTFLKGWRTHIFNLLLAASAIYDQLAPDQVRALLRSIGIPEMQTGTIVLWIAVAGLVLRQVTTTPAGQKAST